MVDFDERTLTDVIAINANEGPVVNQDYVIGKGTGYHDPDALILKMGDGVTPFKDLPNLYDFATPPNDGIIYGMLNGVYAPIVFAEAIITAEVTPDALEFVI